MQEDADASTAEEQRLMRVLKPTHDTWRSTFTSRSAHPSSEVVGSCERENARELCCAAQALVALRRTQKTGTFPVVTLEQICTKVLELCGDIVGTLSVLRLVPQPLTGETNSEFGSNYKFVGPRSA
eukprot:932191-Rhodomonas_salina.2